ncbi:response regulator [Lamprobacter modestohalophilus]|uniref:response regulator n=1 Tax=Lamprobacter modestohalophilus TaxID=1064514 RepID=UPI002ADEF94A|nr:response regulator [Lamprobacter modestohalophilus]MEA1049870.1 response regulator [Lamprobacter modestohalophilus]
MRILVVDDNRLLATILADHLISRGHEAVAAFDGHLAEIFCDRDGYDLLVIDMVLPEIDGVDLLERLRRKHHHCSAIVITGFSELHEREAERLKHLDVAAVLEKPFSFSEVDAIVEGVAA